MALRLPQRVAVVGAGTMGSGIALVFALAGSRVQLMSRRQTSLEVATQRIKSSAALLIEHRLISHTESDTALGRITQTTSLEAAVGDAELVIESIVEDLAAKRDLLGRVEQAAPGAILCTDTSSIAITELAATLARPEAFAGFHWFNPPELVALVEVIPGPRTAVETADCLVEWARAAGKQPVRVDRDCLGFVANRLQYALLREAFALVEAGVCGYAEVDEAMTAGLGPRWAAVGPFESLDLAGLDVHEAVARRLYPTLTGGTEPADAVTNLVSQSALGCKTGRGLYGSYDDAAVEKLVRRRAEVLIALARLTKTTEA